MAEAVETIGTEFRVQELLFDADGEKQEIECSSNESSSGEDSSEEKEDAPNDTLQSFLEKDLHITLGGKRKRTV